MENVRVSPHVKHLALWKQKLPDGEEAYRTEGEGRPAESKGTAHAGRAGALGDDMPTRDKRAWLSKEVELALGIFSGWCKNEDMICPMFTSPWAPGMVL